MNITPYDKLTIKDNFIFQKVMRKKEICKVTLERLLNIEIKDISYPEEEKTMDIRLDSKSIRLDVYVNDDKGTVFNIEMQTSKDMEELEKRTRYYQAIIDIDLIEKGKRYKELNNTYIIFICTFSVFSGKRYKYTFKNRCDEDNSIVLDDGAQKIFLSTKGKMNDISKPLKNFLEYVDGCEPKDDFLKKIDMEVTRIKKCQEWRREYMTLAFEIERQGEIRFAEGEAKGEAKKQAEVIEELIKLVKDNKISITLAAQIAKISEEEFSKKIS